MFFPRTAPLPLTRDEIRELRLSLNTPVVATEELPIGPSRAALLVHEDADGGPQVTIGVRSLRADRVVLYAFEGDLREASSFAVAVDAALSFAESMGFLFDEDELGAGGAPARVRCLGLWREFLGEDALGGAAGERAAQPEPAEELLLDELAEDTALDEATDAPVFLSGDEEAPPAGATDVFVPQFDGDLGSLGADEPPAFESALTFDPDSNSVRVEFDAEGAPDPEASFAGLLDPTDEPAAAVAASAEPDEVEVAVQANPRARTERRASDAPLVSLTKFRAGLAAVEAPPAPREKEPAPVAPAAPQRAKPLGKLRLIRRLRGGGGGARKRHPILRLFGSF